MGMRARQGTVTLAGHGDIGGARYIGSTSSLPHRAPVQMACRSSSSRVRRKREALRSPRACLRFWSAAPVSLGRAHTSS